MPCSALPSWLCCWPRAGTLIACASTTSQPGTGHFRSFGSHVALAFVNDINRDGEDRNLMLERAVFYRE